MPVMRTAAETAAESFRPSLVQTASAAEQSDVAGSPSVSIPVVDGRTLPVTLRFCPRTVRLTSIRHPPLTSRACLSAVSRIP